jgi:hypothetical protein
MFANSVNETNVQRQTLRLYMRSEKISNFINVDCSSKSFLFVTEALEAGLNYRTDTTVSWVYQADFLGRKMHQRSVRYVVSMK